MAKGTVIPTGHRPVGELYLAIKHQPDAWRRYQEVLIKGNRAAPATLQLLVYRSMIDRYTTSVGHEPCCTSCCFGQNGQNPGLLPPAVHRLVQTGQSVHLPYTVGYRQELVNPWVSGKTAGNRGLFLMDLVNPYSLGPVR